MASAPMRAARAFPRAKASGPGQFTPMPPLMPAKRQPPDDVQRDAVRRRPKRGRKRGVCAA